MSVRFPLQLKAWGRKLLLLGSIQTQQRELAVALARPLVKAACTMKTDRQCLAAIRFDAADTQS